jgi:hypothetical protein
MALMFAAVPLVERKRVASGLLLGLALAKPQFAAPSPCGCFSPRTYARSSSQPSWSSQAGSLSMPTHTSAYGRR